ncbi:hypothetical protein K439DRAFT_1615892 [Ramaria rubella]|nr:hypothetical protein K439DRAFT_1615892 [Ramaria rubella]
MRPTIFELLRTFDEQNRFNGNNYASWVTEFNMTFGEDTDFMSHINGTSTMLVLTTDNSARLAADHPYSPPQTPNAVWLSLKAEYQKDSRATRFELKKHLYNLTHDIAKPISIYIQDIITAAEALTSLGHEPAATDVVDSILMNLDPSFAIVRTLLTTQTSEPSLAAVKKALTDQEDTKLALTGELDDKPSESAMHAKCSNKRSKPKTSRKKKVSSSDTNSDSDDTHSYDWLNPSNKDVCHRCGRPGHRSSHCIADMPQSVKDKVIRMAKKR